MNSERPIQPTPNLRGHVDAETQRVSIRKRPRDSLKSRRSKIEVHGASGKYSPVHGRGNKGYFRYLEHSLTVEIPYTCTKLTGPLDPEHLV